MFVNKREHATAHLAIILPVEQPAHPVAALNVAAWVQEVCGLNPVLGVGLQAIKGYQHWAHVNADLMHARQLALMGPRQGSCTPSEMCNARLHQTLTWPFRKLLGHCGV
jgi:hypothetical protein